MEFAQGLLSTRRGSTILGIVAAAIAGILLLVYISQYRDSVNSSNKSVPVIVAKSLIQKGTPGDVIGSSGLFQATSIAKDQVREGAFLDSASLHGKVAAADIFPGQQLTAADFVAASAGTVTTRLTGNQRAISLPIDASHGLVGQVQAGDHVDVLVGLNSTTASGTSPVIESLLQNTLVLRAPATAGGLTSNGSNIILRATSKQAAELAWASDNGQIWIVLRPTANATTPVTPVVTAKTFANGVK